MVVLRFDEVSHCCSFFCAVRMQAMAHSVDSALSQEQFYWWLHVGPCFVAQC